MSLDARALRDSYRAAIARTHRANELLEALEPGTPLFCLAAEGLSRCLRAEIAAGRTFMAVEESSQSSRVN